MNVTLIGVPYHAGAGRRDGRADDGDARELARLRTAPQRVACVLNAHATVVARVEDALAAADLPRLSWYDVLWAMRRAPGRRLRMAELVAGLTVSRGRLTKLADRLEAAGLLRREPADDDRRDLYAALTNDGNEMLLHYSHVLRDTLLRP